MAQSCDSNDELARQVDDDDEILRKQISALTIDQPANMPLHAIAEFFVIPLNHNHTCSSHESAAKSPDTRIVELFQKFLMDYNNKQVSVLEADGLSSRSRIILLYNIMIAKCEKLPKETNDDEDEFWQVREKTVWWMDKLPCVLQFANLRHTIRQQPIVRRGRRESLAQVGNLAYPEGGDYKAITRRLYEMHEQIEANGKDPRELAKLLINSRKTGQCVTSETLGSLGCRSNKSDVDFLHRTLLLLDIEVVRRLHSFRNVCDLLGKPRDVARVPFHVDNDFDSIPVAVGIARFLFLCAEGVLKVGDIFTNSRYPLFNDNPFHRIAARKSIDEFYANIMEQRKQNCDDTADTSEPMALLLKELESSFGY